MDFVIGGLAGAGATIFTNPMDVVKTRLQLQGEMRARSELKARYRNMFHASLVIAKADGISALQKGLAPAMLFGFTMNSVRLGIFHLAESNGWTQNKNGNVDITKAVFWSGVSGVVSGFSGNPASLLKTRIQATSHPSIAVGRQHKYKGLIDGCIQIYKFEGMKGFFAGINAACTRLAIGSSAQLTSFTLLKEYMKTKEYFGDSPIILSFVASLGSGVMCILLETPLDVVNTRLYNQGTANKGELLYRGLWDCLNKIYKTEGLHGLYKGMGPLYLRLAPHTTLSLVIWDMLNNYYTKIKRT